MVVGWEGGSATTVCTMDCIRAVVSLLDTIINEFGLPDAPLNVGLAAYNLFKGQSRYRHPWVRPLSERK